MASAALPRFSSQKPPEKAGKIGHPVLFSINEMPKWFQSGCNPKVLAGYRAISGSARASFYSWSYLHNESVNIYSHLIPAVFFLFCEWYIPHYLASNNSGVTRADLVAYSIFISSAIKCLSLSATYHTLMNHSEHVEHLCLRLDMLGVVTFILGDLILGTYITFWCEPRPRNTYWFMIGIFALLAMFMTVRPKYQGTRYRLFRAVVFVATGLLGVAPLIHRLKMFGMPQMMRKAFPYTLAKAGFLLSGTLFYATRYPEIQYPGNFDLWGGSHSLFHILVVCAAVVQFIGYLDAFDYAHANITCSSL